jgi:hypothetical protein
MTGDEFTNASLVLALTDLADLESLFADGACQPVLTEMLL